MTLFMTEPALGQAVTLAEAKAHMRIDTGDEDDLIGKLIGVATAYLEAETGLGLMTEAWRLTLDRWPASGIVRFWRGPVQKIDAVTVYDGEGNAIAIDVSAAVLDGHARPARLYLGTVERPGRALNGIEIDFTAGFGDTASDVPDALKQAILLHVAHMYEFRGAVPLASQPAGVPAGYARLTAPFRRRAL